MNRAGARGGEKGSGVIGLIAAMPLIGLLFAAFGVTFVFGVRAYLFLLSDWALQEQVGYAMERMMTDLRYAEDVRLDGGRLKVFCSAADGPAAWVVYEKTQETQSRIMRDSQPLTGHSVLGPIAMREFRAERVGDRTVLLRLIGENLMTERTYELETAVTWTGKGT